MTIDEKKLLVRDTKKTIHVRTDSGEHIEVHRGALLIGMSLYYWSICIIDDTNIDRLFVKTQDHNKF
jgi:hypothetical protein